MSYILYKYDVYLVTKMSNTSYHVYAGRFYSKFPIKKVKKFMKSSG